MHDLPNLVRVTGIKFQRNAIKTERTASDRVGGVSDSKRLMKIASSFLRYVSNDVSRSWNIPLVGSPVLGGVGQNSRFESAPQGWRGRFGTYCYIPLLALRRAPALLSRARTRRSYETDCNARQTARPG